MKKILFCLFAMSLCVIITTSCCCCSDSNTSSTGSTDNASSPDIGKAFQKGFKYGWNCESARQAFDKGDTDKAISLYKEAITIDPEDKEAYIGISNVYMAKSEYTEAVINLKKAQAIDPKDDNITALLEKAQAQIDNQ